MKIEHIAIWVQDLERMKDFYTRYFGAVAHNKYYNPQKKFQSYFLSFENGCRLELMQQSGKELATNNRFGLIHFAISLGNKNAVDQLTQQLGNDGYTIHGQPRITGDGYYESVVADPENNLIELTE